MKNNYYILIWIQKTAFVHLNTGTEFLNFTLQDNILDMGGSDGFVYVLTENGIFQYFQSNFSLAKSINTTFDQNSKI